MTRACATALVLFFLAGYCAAEDDASTLVKKMEDRIWSGTSRGHVSMTVETPNWQRTLELKVWMNFPRQTFIRVLAPKKEEGIGSLRIGDEMWNYIPKVDRVIKVPPSMMLQPWMGSDFSNDDLVKETSLLEDYQHEIVDVTTEGGIDIAHIVATPKPNAPVVWGRIELWLRSSDGIPLRQRYFDEAGTAVKELTYDRIQEMDGRLIPTRWVMQPLQDEGHKTQLLIEEMTFSEPIEADIFTQRNLRSPVW